MKHITLKNFGLITGTIVGTVGLAIVPASALATSNTASTGSTSTSSKQAARLQLIINRGNAEINRRLNTLGTLGTKISAATKLTSADQASLTSEVNDEVSGLQSLKISLDADTTLTGAETDAHSIFSGYRVYALIVPKVYLIKTADDQQVTETKLSTLVTKLQTAITTDQTAGKSVTSLQNSLNDMTSKVQAAQTISSNIETTVLPLMPSDYNTDHTILSGDRDQLKTAQTDITTAITDAKSIISGLKSL